MKKLIRKHQANSVRREARRPGGFTPTPLASPKLWGAYPHVSKKVWGFTLVEMVVAVGLFALVTVVLTSTFLTVFRNQRNAFAFVHMQNNVRHALEVMGREMRTGGGFSSDGRSITFIDDRGRTVTYSLPDNTHIIQKRVSRLSPPLLITAPVTARNVRVTRLAFNLTGHGAGDTLQPRITIFIRVEPEARPGEPRIFSTDLQLTITPRGLDM